MVAGRRHLTGAVVVTTSCVLAACGPGGSESADGPPASGGGISRKEYCAGRPVITRITAQQERTAVVVRWSEVFSSLDDRTFRVYRRSGPDAPWSRVAEVELPPGNGGSWRDAAPSPSRTTQYGVTQVNSTCGEGRLCTSTHPGAECSLATVVRREQ